ncbi:SDR family NAD(P)-dependent oxidoreductase [Compostibacter hankyongensis]|uniref:SDR family NAD(P)-dependent oxidoreductase n=2 Tax=Compostibacter hankyongensis TaxID=1007089 RepID=A0ABP8FG18_9BACT
MITGATSGIGKACAQQFAAGGYDLILTGRREERLLALKQELEQAGDIQIHTLCFDVRDREAVHAALEGLPAAWKKIAVLINNAGLAAGLASVSEGDIDDWEVMIDTNLKGLLYVSRQVLPWMQAGKKGHVFNIGSTAGKGVYPNGNVYCATKHAVDALSKAMRIDLLPYGIKVTAIHPGAVETEFSLVRFKGDAQKAEAVYKGFVPLEGKDVAEIVFFCAGLPPHVCINDLVVTSTAQADAHYFHKLI